MVNLFEKQHQTEHIWSAGICECVRVIYRINNHFKTPQSFLVRRRRR